MVVRKAVSQPCQPTQELLLMMDIFKEMVNRCIRIGLDHNVSTLKKLSMLSYNQLQEYHIPSYYKLTAISQAAGRLAQIKRSIKRGIKTKSPFVSRPYITTCYGFKINYMLLSIPTGRRESALLRLNDYTISKLEGVKPKSFTITPECLSISVEKEMEEIKPESIIGIDRNLRNVTISNGMEHVMYKTDKLLSISENTSHVMASFRRCDVRSKKFYQKRLGNRRSRRTQQFLHKISKDIVSRAVKTKSMIVLEDIKGIRKLYRKGNGQGNRYRRRLNSWPFYELQRQIEYKAAWVGILVKYVDPKRTSQLCPICGKRTQEDRLHRRKLWCNNCGKTMDRDVAASMNIAHNGWTRFIHPRGLPNEAVMGNAENLQPLILRVNGSKLVSGIASR